jgi:sporadic carbohydrate cluster 2OG-Fe(II) oxygenase
MERNLDFQSLIYRISKDYLHSLVGSELAMQKRTNLSIQIPHDESSLLTIHADTWQGDSPFEIVVWLPLVDCFNTKSMYLTHPTSSETINSLLLTDPHIDNTSLYNNLKSNVNFLNIKYGQVLLFNQSLPHGNIVNSENETRWSLNCRFKGLFTPYGDKKLGEFFVPITPKPMSILGLEYKTPKLQ